MKSNNKQLTTSPSKNLRVNILQLTDRRGFSTLIIILIVAVIGVVALLAFGVLDLGNINRSKPAEVSQVNEDPMLGELKVLGASDQISVIEKDLNNTKLNIVDQELPQIDKDASSL